MATPTAWLLNLDADEELASPERYRPRSAPRIRELAKRMTLLLAPSDMILSEERLEDSRPRRALCFCPTPSALARMRTLGLEVSAAPDAAVLRRANHRAFCAEIGQTLEGARYVHSMDELEAVLRTPTPTGDFVLKRPFGFAGRERRRAVSGVLDVSTRGFAARSFARGEGLQVEPWLLRGRDFSLHGYLQRGGELLVGPLVEQRCDAMGRWQHAELAAPGALAPAFGRSLEEELERSARALEAIGYFGPFGIDAFEYQDGRGCLSFQPRSEINARFTMGYPRALLERALPPLDLG